MKDHDHTDDCPDCALVEKLLDVISKDGRFDPIAHLKALGMVTLTILESLNGEDDDDDHQTDGNA